jgi:1-acyl-sn-glycerol-3-phosphate acyltransferase
MSLDAGGAPESGGSDGLGDSAESSGLLNAFFSIWTWTEVAALIVLCFWVQLALALVTWPFDAQRRITGRTLRLLGGVLPSSLSPLWSFRVHGELPRSLPARFVAVSNHESQADPFIISRLPWEMKWLCKASLFRIPFAGWCMWLAGDVPLHRGDRSSAQDAMVLCRRKLEAGMPVMIFPEGTRSKTGEMLPFKAGAFRLAIETGADILPIAISGTRQALPKHSWRVGKSRALVTVGAPISTRGMTSEDITRLSDLARAQIEELRLMLVRART